ncbi:MAG: carbohydrate binding family 9 domain-containing protein, partial [Candidatus Aminicenantes bacterium]|nr:carbohydrate binding family 9 domain-containing protein [Candidatus Aminicenantes bacterium]
MKYISLFLVLFLAVNTYPQGLLHQKDVPEIQAVRTEEAIEIDGILTEIPWQTEGYSDFLQSDPWDGSPATEKTVVWIVYDQKNLYIAARMYDKEPDKIIDLLGRRDEEVESDWFTFAVDPYFDKRSGFLFAVNPAGSIRDGTLFNDEGKDYTWDGVWDCAALIDDQGWSIEIRIPFLQLRFKKKSIYTWGVNFFRETKR